MAQDRISPTFSAISETSLRAMAKAMKAMKRVSKFAKGRFANSVVFRGTKTATSGGLTKANLMKNKNGKIVSKKANANGKKAYARIKGWTVAVQKARRVLGVKGFCAGRRVRRSTRRPRSSTATERGAFS